MPIGEGKYDKECTLVHEVTKAAATLLIVVGGERGSGFSMTLDVLRVRPFALAPMLREIADQIEADVGRMQ